jgi:hypothetical protein
MNKFPSLKDMDRPTFIGRLNYFVHPSQEVSRPEQLKGRDVPLRSLRDVFETNGAHAFVWGLRGVGKTSLVHTACAQYDNIVRLATAIACQKESTANELMNDIFRRVYSDGKVNLKDKSLAARLSFFGVSLEGRLQQQKDELTIRTVNHASDFLGTLFSGDGGADGDWVIIIDEFDQLENQTTIGFFTALAKQLSVDKVPVKFVFCGVTSNLNDLIGSHESVDRYLKAIHLEPLIDGHIMQIASSISEEMGVQLLKGQYYRIAQIACGYPHFAHVIMDQVLRAAYDEAPGEVIVSPSIFKLGVQNAAKSAAVRLRRAYETATKKGTDKYVEVLWAVADGQLLSKQFKEIYRDYNRIMDRRASRERLSSEEHMRNHLNRLCKDSYGCALTRSGVGWYSFTDPMLRSYVRMLAHNADIDLGEESFRT